MLYLSLLGEHIGYGIRSSEGRKGYAYVRLSLAVIQCKVIGLSKAIKTCSKSNIGSSKRIIKNGGVLVSEDIDHGEVFQRYWISLNRKLIFSHHFYM